MKNKKDKGFIKFVLPYFIIGAISGLIFAILEFNGILDNIKINGLDNFLINVSPYILIVLGLIISIVLIIMVKSSKKEVKVLKDEELDKLERKLNYALTLSNVLLFSMLILFGISFYNFLDRDINILVFVITILLYFIYIYIASNSQAKIVEIVKTIDPLKKGNVYDNNFSEEWLNSCDELEKKLIYQVCFKTFNFMNAFLIVLFVLLVFLGMFFGCCLFPMILTGIISFVQNMVYCYYAIKIENNMETFD